MVAEFLQRDLEPMKMLVAAVVARACEDLDLGQPFTRRAQEWFEDSEPGHAWSFEWCCAILSLDPGAVRRQVGGPQRDRFRRGGTLLRIARP